MEIESICVIEIRRFHVSAAKTMNKLEKKVLPGDNQVTKLVSQVE